MVSGNAGWVLESNKTFGRFPVYLHLTATPACALDAKSKMDSKSKGIVFERTIVKPLKAIYATEAKQPDR